MLVDTYDTLAGVRHAIEAARTVGVPLRGVRIDSGDLLALSRAARAAARRGRHARTTLIIASGDLDEQPDRAAGRGRRADRPLGRRHRPRHEPRLARPSAASTSWWPTSAAQGGWRGTIKPSPGKATLPGPKQVFRRYEGGQMSGDVIASASEQLPGRAAAGARDARGQARRERVAGRDPRRARWQSSRRCRRLRGSSRTRIRALPREPLRGLTGRRRGAARWTNKQVSRGACEVMQPRSGASRGRWWDHAMRRRFSNPEGDGEMPSARPNGRSMRLSPLDAAFLEVESPTAHMHVGWVALFRPRAGSQPTALRRAAPPDRGPRARSRRATGRSLPGCRSGLHDPEWIDDPAFDIRHHVRHSTAREIGRLVEHVYSTPLDARPAAVGGLDHGPARRRAHRRGRQGAPLHGRRHRRGRAREPASATLTAEPPPVEPAGAVGPAPPSPTRPRPARRAPSRTASRDQLRVLEIPKQVIRSPTTGLRARGRGGSRRARAVPHALPLHPARDAERADLAAAHAGDRVAAARGPAAHQAALRHDGQRRRAGGRRRRRALVPARSR